MMKITKAVKIRHSHVAFKRAIRDSDDSKLGLGGAVNLVITPDDSQVIVAGFNENAITIFNRDINGELEHSQTLTNGEQQITNMQAPQGLAISPDGRYLYAACSASNALVVFERNEQGKYSFFQTISNEQNIISGLGGASFVTTSPDGNRVYVAAESDKAIVTLARQQDGRLQFLSATKSEGMAKYNELNGPAFVYTAADGKHLIVTTGKGDTLIVYELD